MTPYALIPAKATSERLPGKNMRKLGGKTLVQRAIEVAQESGLFGNHICVSSESTEILNHAIACGVHALRRPEALSDPDATIQHVIEHAAEQLEWRDPFFILTPTSPFRQAKTMVYAWKLYEAEDPGALLSVRPYTHPPYWAMNMDDKTHRLQPLDESCFVIPRQHLPITWHHDGAHQIISHGRPGVLGLPVRWEESVDINTDIEWAFAEYLLASSRIPWATAIWETNPG